MRNQPMPLECVHLNDGASSSYVLKMQKERIAYKNCQN